MNILTCKVYYYDTTYLEFFFGVQDFVAYDISTFNYLLLYNLFEIIYPSNTANSIVTNNNNDEETPDQFFIRQEREQLELIVYLYIISLF